MKRQTTRKIVGHPARECDRSSQNNKRSSNSKNSDNSDNSRNKNNHTIGHARIASHHIRPDRTERAPISTHNASAVVINSNNSNNNSNTIAPTPRRDTRSGTKGTNAPGNSVGSMPAPLRTRSRALPGRSETTDRFRFRVGVWFRFWVCRAGDDPPAVAARQPVYVCCPPPPPPFPHFKKNQLKKSRPTRFL